METIKKELSKKFIELVFAKYPGKGIETNLFFRMAAEAGVYVPNTYGTIFGQTIEELCEVVSVADENGNFAYNAFYLKK